MLADSHTRIRCAKVALQQRDVKCAAYKSSFMAARPIVVARLQTNFPARWKAAQNKNVRLDLSKSREM
jgi:hypothetical protein